MYGLKQLNYDVLRDEVYSVIKNRKNLIFYDGIKDCLEENIVFKFFYSNPHDPLEFITIDIYNKVEKIKIDGKTMESLGLISIIKEKPEHILSNFENINGYVVVEDIKIRNVDKIKIQFHINRNGISNMKDVIEYFENNLCSKNK
jgi:hypothetical protein